ncbi:MAG: lamin tail domain-containing protein [Deltaproteobacteria bacterium]|jgi:hypothetical protein|nr:lamin tail domain-containing protein [Deltaproteobacteria bacterium]MBW2533998.1 lamin tail domain-containing protein [Deltaproteobacteria bacterium]
MNTLRLSATAISTALLLAGCAVDATGEDVGTEVSAVNQAQVPIVSIVEVGYGGTGYHDGEKIIFPEYVVLRNEGTKSAKLGGWYLTDGAEFSTWAGDGIAQLPGGTHLAPGEELVIANHPPVTVLESNQGYRQVSFEYAYGYAPDLEIGGWDSGIRDAELVKANIRLKHRQCSYDAYCEDVQELIMLIDGDRLSVEEVVGLVEAGAVPEDAIASVYPE